MGSKSAGPESLTYADMMRTLAVAAGRRPPWILPVPVLSPRLSSYWLRFVTSVPTNIARALIEGLRHDFEADDAALRGLVPQRLLSFREAVEAAFAIERRGCVVTRWTEGVFAVRAHHIDYASMPSGPPAAQKPQWSRPRFGARSRPSAGTTATTT